MDMNRRKGLIVNPITLTIGMLYLQSLGSLAHKLTFYEASNIISKHGNK